MPEPPGGYRYYRDAELGPAYTEAMDALFGAYAAALPAVTAWAEQQFPRRDGEPEAAHARAVKAKALDLLRGLLPAASLSHMGIFATGQTYEQLILHLLAHPLPEARAFGEMILREVRAVMPSFVARVERPDRGGEWIDYLREREEATRRWVAHLGLERDDVAAADRGPAVRLLHVDGTQEDMLAALPEEVGAAGQGDAYRAALDRSRSEYERLVAAGLERAAPYALCLGYRIRYVLDLNAREAMQLIELRSGREGHPTYRAVAHEMHRQIAEVHPIVAAAMTHVDTETEPRLERVLAEMRTQAKRAAAGVGSPSASSAA